MSTRLPTELQCLALRMRNTAQELAQAAAQLPDLFTDWQPGQAAPTGVNLAASEMLAQARTLEFDAQRLGYLADEFTENDRAAFSFANATARWLIESFRAGSSSPKVCVWPSGMKMGS